ncbi:MAG: hypothetical protein EON60_01465 [Alphaproteobacteria bacterium]|nr:MAG: hypothetical protein EON60_01465 [Alphaproteobacteria bacterium]
MPAIRTLNICLYIVLSIVVCAACYHVIMLTLQTVMSNAETHLNIPSGFLALIVGGLVMMAFHVNRTDRLAPWTSYTRNQQAMLVVIAVAITGLTLLLAYSLLASAPVAAFLAAVLNGAGGVLVHLPTAMALGTLVVSPVALRYILHP